MKKETKMNNKGFSLVELIVVIAIMAVLVGVLAPSLLRYVEKSRLQKDNSAISEICQAIKIALADEDINTEVSSSAFTVTTSGKTYTFSGTSKIESELALTLGTSVTLTSNTYTNAPTIKVTVSNGTVTISVDGYRSDTDVTATTKTDW